MVYENVWFCLTVWANCTFFKYAYEGDDWYLFQVNEQITHDGFSLWSLPKQQKLGFSRYAVGSPLRKKSWRYFWEQGKKEHLHLSCILCMAIEDCSLNKQENRRVNRILITHICLSDLAGYSCSSVWAGELQCFVLPSHSRNMEFLTQWQWFWWINVATFATWPPLFS